MRTTENKTLPAIPLGLVAIIATCFVFCNGVIAQTEQLTVLDYSVLPEASGIGVSTAHDDLLWFINDSGSNAELVSLDLKTRSYAVVEVAGAKSVDWEDLEVFEYAGDSWLLVADVGDNFSRREHVTLYLLREPDKGDGEALVHAEIVLKYPDGARDAESIAVDPDTASVYLLSKRERRPRLYRVGLEQFLPGGSYERVPEFLGKVSSIPPPSKKEMRRFPKYGKNRARPTAMTLLRDGSAIALMTYRGAYLAKLSDDRDWLHALNNSICAIDTPNLAQGETIAADSQGRLYLTSEGRKAPLIRMPALCKP